MIINWFCFSSLQSNVKHSTVLLSLVFDRKWDPEKKPIIIYYFKLMYILPDLVWKKWQWLTSESVGQTIQVVGRTFVGGG